MFPSCCRRLLRAPILARVAIGVVWLIGATGCISVYGHRDVAIEVVDGDSGQPLPGATIAVVAHGDKLVLNAPKPTDATTDASGSASLRVATYEPMYWRFAATGYEALDDVVATGFLPRDVRVVSVRDEPLRARVALFRSPAPDVVLILPDGFRGPVALAIAAEATDDPVTPGVREIALDLPPDGRLRAALPLPFNRVDEMNPRVRMRTRDGAMLATARIDVDPTEIRQRRIGARFDGAESRLLFVVGTTEDAIRIRDAVAPTVASADGRASTRTEWSAFARYFGDEK